MYEHNICCSKLVEDLRSPCLRVFRPYFMLTYVKRALPVFRLKRASSTYYSIFHVIFCCILVSCYSLSVRVERIELLQHHKGNQTLNCYYFFLFKKAEEITNVIGGMSFTL